MSFSKEVKEELSKTENLADKQAIKYELLGYLTSSHISKEKQKIKFSTENEYNINRFSRLLSNLNIHDYDIFLQGNVYGIIVEQKFIDKLEILKIDLQTIPQEYIKHVIRGMYLGGGSINNPENTYHLEMSVQKKKEAIWIMQTLQKFDIKSNILEKKKEYAIYIKDGEEISKFLALLGANKSVLRFEEIRVQREMNNKINRIVNCESANLNKTINASIEQIEAIRKLKEKHQFENLSDSLKEIANLRLKNPNASLIELGQKLTPPVGKSAVNYRLKKIMEIANEG